MNLIEPKGYERLLSMSELKDLLQLTSVSDQNSLATAYSSLISRGYLLFFNEKYIIVSKNYGSFLAGRKLNANDTFIDKSYGIDLSIRALRSSDIFIYHGGYTKVGSFNKAECVVITHEEGKPKSEFNLYDLSISLYGERVKNSVNNSINKIPNYIAFARFVMFLQLRIDSVKLVHSQEESLYHNLIVHTYVKKKKVRVFSLQNIFRENQTLEIYVFLASIMGLSKGTCLILDESINEFHLSLEPVEDACLSLVQWFIDYNTPIVTSFSVDEDSSQAVAETLYSDPSNEQRECQYDQIEILCNQCSLAKPPKCYKEEAMNRVSNAIDAIASFVSSSEYP